MRYGLREIRLIIYAIARVGKVVLRPEPHLKDVFNLLPVKLLFQPVQRSLNRQLVGKPGLYII